MAKLDPNYKLIRDNADLRKQLVAAEKREKVLRDKVCEGTKLLARCLARMTFLEKRSNIATLEGDDLRKLDLPEPTEQETTP